MALDATLFNDPGCPWGYSVSPALAVLRWRFGDGLRWRIAMIGLAEDTARYERSGYTPATRALSAARFGRRFGMPVSPQVRPRVIATGRACRAVVATRRLFPEREWAVMRALQFAWFCTDALLDEDEAIGAVLAGVEGVDADAVVAALADPATEEAYQRDRAEARTAAGSPTEAQGRSAATDGPVRYTAPSVIFSDGEGRRLEAGGFQNIEAYDVCVANLDPTLPRRGAPADPYDALAAFDHGLTTQEMAAILAPHLEDPDPVATQDALIELVAEGRATRTPLGNDALWRAA